MAQRTTWRPAKVCRADGDPSSLALVFERAVLSDWKAIEEAAVSRMACLLESGQVRLFEEARQQLLEDAQGRISAAATQLLELAGQLVEAIGVDLQLTEELRTKGLARKVVNRLKERAGQRARGNLPEDGQ